MGLAMLLSAAPSLFRATLSFWAPEQDAFKRTCCVFRPDITAAEFEDQEHRDHQKTGHRKTNNPPVE